MLAALEILSRLTGAALRITQRSQVHVLPPPPTDSQSPVESPRFRGLSCCFSVLQRGYPQAYRAFLSGPAQPCVCSVRRVARRERPARSTFATEARTDVALHRAALCMPHAAALFNRIRGLGGQAKSAPLAVAPLRCGRSTGRS